MPKRSSPRPLALPGMEAALAPPTRPVSPAAKALTLPRGKSRSRARCTVAPAPKPWECVVLAVDTAAHSGWSIWRKGNLEAHGEVDTLDARAVSEIVQRALTWSDPKSFVQVPLVLVLERAWGRRMHVIAGLAAAKERWKRAWRDAKQAEARVVTVQPSTWRTAVLGSGFARAERSIVRRAEQSMAAGLVGRAVGGDEAPGILIGHWASYAPAVGEAIGKRAARASLKAWQGGKS